MRPQQEMNYGGVGHDSPGFTYSGYEGQPVASFPGQKLSGSDRSQATTTGHRLALAIVSLGTFVLLTFGMVVMAAATNASKWVIFPMLFVLFLFSVVAITINIVFNHKS